MVNDSQRGYLSGILQRGARIPGPTARISPARRPAPAPVPLLDPISSDLLPEIEQFSEPVHPQESSRSEAVAEEPHRLVQVVPRPPEPQPANNPAPQPPTSHEPAPSETRTVFSSFPPASADPLPALSTMNAGREPTERNEWGERLPRLIRADGDELRGNSIKKAPRTSPSGNDQETVAEVTRRLDSSPGESSHTASIVRADSHQGVTAETVSTRDDQSKLQRIESSDAEPASLLVQNFQTSQVVLLQSLQPEQDKSSPAAAVPIVRGENDQLAEFLALRAEPIEQSRELIVEHLASDQRDQSVIWSPSPPRDEFSGGARPQSPLPRQESPKLTINRLDVQIVNQSVPPVVQLPAPAPVPQLGELENLERFYLGHIDLIF